MSTFLNGDPNSTPADGDGLVYDSALGAWVPGAAISGGVPVFGSQAEAQAYEADNPGKVALWFDDGTGPEPVTASAPTANDNTNTITIPTVTGVDYRIDGNIVTGIYNVGNVATSVTVTATPQSGYYLASGGSSSWTFAFTDAIYVGALQSVFQDGGQIDVPEVPVDSISLDSPATAGTVLVASIGLDKANDGTLAPPSGWTEVVRTTNLGAGLIVAYRVAEGGEQTFQWDGVLGRISYGGRYVLHLSEFQATAPTAVASVEASSGAVNSLANDPGPAPHDGLAVAFAVVDTAWSNTAGETWSVANGPDWPSGGYTQLGHAPRVAVHSSVAHAVATKQVNAGDPTALVVQNTTAVTDELILAVLFLGMP